MNLQGVDINKGTLDLPKSNTEHECKRNCLYYYSGDSTSITNNITGCEWSSSNLRCIMHTLPIGGTYGASKSSVCWNILSSKV